MFKQETNVQTFNSAKFGALRTQTVENGQILFCLNDVAKALELSNPRNLVQRLNERGVHSVDTPTHNQHGAMVMQAMNFIDEPNLYRCIFQSRKKEAEQFQTWVFEEVLPSIRQNGGYNSKPLSTLDLLELTIKGMRENQLELQEVKKDVLELKAQVTTRPDYYTVVGYGTLHGISVNIKMASSIGRKASNICKERGLDTDTIPDPRFGVVKTYPSKVLDEAFRMPLTPKTNN